MLGGVVLLDECLQMIADILMLLLWGYGGSLSDSRSNEKAKRLTLTFALNDYITISQEEAQLALVGREISDISVAGL